MPPRTENKQHTFPDRFHRAATHAVRGSAPERPRPHWAASCWDNPQQRWEQTSPAGSRTSLSRCQLDRQRHERSTCSQYNSEPQRTQRNGEQGEYKLLEGKSDMAQSFGFVEEKLTPR